jgi:hypothetical protein
MEVICSSLTSLDFQRATRRYIRGQRVHHNRHWENFRSCKPLPSSHIQTLYCFRTPRCKVTECGEDSHVCRHWPKINSNEFLSFYVTEGLTGQSTEHLCAQNVQYPAYPEEWSSECLVHSKIDEEKPLKNVLRDDFRLNVHWHLS